MSSDPVARIGGRLLVLSPAGRVLLIHERIEDGSTHWLTPGGGTEGSESPRQAAQREAVEEVGLEIALPPDAEPVLVTRRRWGWDGVVYDQADHFYLAPVDAEIEPAPAALTAMEESTLLGYRWWSVDDLRRSDAVIVPPELADVLARLLAVQR